MTTKQKFDVEDPPVVVLQNGRYAYRVKCPWVGKNDKELYAFKFCSAQAYRNFIEQQERPESPVPEEAEQSEAEPSESERPESPEPEERPESPA